MKVAVINVSGNVGKTTVSNQLVMPRLSNPEYIPVESANADGTEEGTLMRGKQYGEILEALALVDDAVVDVGSSNFEEFLNRMTDYRNSHEDFDFYVVPTTAPDKQQIDTIKTIEALAENGVPAKKIRLCFNIVDRDVNVQSAFAGLFAYHAAHKKFTLKPAAVIHANEIYPKLKVSGQKMADVLNDPQDLKELLKAAKSTEEKLEISRRIGIKRLAAGVTDELNTVFKVLFT